jgi:hypothetical protein
LLPSSLTWLSKNTANKDLVFNRSKNDRGRHKEAVRLITHKRLYKRKKNWAAMGKKKGKEFGRLPGPR